MKQKITLGFGCIHAEKGEVRAFLPAFVQKMAKIFDQVVIEQGYGSTMGISEEAYTKKSNILFADIATIFQQDIVLVLRYPKDEHIATMRPGACLVSMCHFPTRPERVTFLREHHIEAISMDSIKDDNGQRLVENLRSVAWNGCEVAFDLLNQLIGNPGLNNTNRDPLNVTILGSGGVGQHAVQAAIRYGNPDLWKNLAARNVPGNILTVIDHDLTNHKGIVKSLLQKTNLLIDATQRKNPSEIIIPNAFLDLMPLEAVILDLSVDPYDFTHEPHEVKGIEGIPQGNLDQYVFSPDDPAWSALPDEVSTNARRWVVSCYSWPGIHPRACMIRYGNQLSPLLRHIAKIGGVGKINPQGRFYDRALSRSMLSHWK